MVSVADYGPRGPVPGSRPGRGTVCCGLEQVTLTHCLVLVKLRKPWTNCDEAGDYVVPNVLSPWDLVSRPDSMDKSVLSSGLQHCNEWAHGFFNSVFLFGGKCYVLFLSCMMKNTKTTRRQQVIEK